MGYIPLNSVCPRRHTMFMTVYLRLRNNPERYPSEKRGGRIYIDESIVDDLMAVRKKKSHGRTRTWVYSRWTSLLHNHRGNVPDEWLTFEGFIADVGEPPDRTHTFMRHDAKLAWSKDNSGWMKK